jgi:hypothetical protein
LIATATDHSLTDASRKPKALALHVKLSDKTYVSGLYNQKTSLKVDVFFNGTLSACLFIPIHDIRSGAKSNHQVFAGTRIDFLAERPWVILSPEVAADGSVRQNNTTATVEQRWRHLCQALQTEARERGTDEEGNRPPTAEFLDALATMQMPEQVRSMQKPGGKTFGIIDVVVTAGEGRKLTSGVGYLKAPKRMIDESYLFVPGADGNTVHQRTDVSGKRESGAEPQNAIESSSEVIDVDAEGGSDPDYGSHTKRQALQSEVQLTRGSSPMLASTPQHSTMDSLLPSLPPPDHVGLSTPALVAPRIAGSGLVSTPVQRSASSFNASTSPEFGRSDEQFRIYEQQANAMSQAGFISKMMYPGFPSNLQTPQMHPSPYAVQFSDPTLGGVAPSDLMRQILFHNAGPTSSLLDSFPTAFQDPNLPASSFPTPIAGLQHGPSRFGSYAYSSPDQPHSAFSETHYARRNYNLSAIGPLSDAPEPYQPNTLPQAPALLGMHELRSQLAPFPPFDRRLSLPLPPAALYSVPTKPKRNLSPRKVSPLEKLRKVKPSFTVRRLVIYGESKSILVDHQWEPAQQIDVPIDGPAKHRTEEAVAPDDNSHAISVEQAKKSTDLHGPRKSTARMDTPPPTSPSEHVKPELTTTIGERNQTSACQTNVETDQSVKSPGKVELDGKQDLCVTKQRPLRRTTSSNNILGVQGPKANQFWLEDPEEILREASARLRRSRSVAKQGDTPDAVLPPKNVMSAVQTPKAWETDTSSPLSSLHTTPEPEIETTLYTLSPQAPVESSPSPISQVDGSPERKALPETLRGNQTPSPVKLASSFTTPKLPRNDPSTPQSSATKKRKNLHRTLPKEPRSPTRLKTNHNPPLNRDCVIAYAESKDKKNKQGILRQVKSERLGVFTESDVVFAARFFVEE